MRADIHPAYSDVKVTCSVERPTRHVQQKVTIFQSMSARNAILSTPVSRKSLIPADVSIGSISALVIEQFLNRVITKAAVVVASVLPGVAVATSCPVPQTLSPLLKIDRVIDGDTVKLDDGSRVRLTGFNTFELKILAGSVITLSGRNDVQSRCFEVNPSHPWPAPKDKYGRLLANLWMGEAYLGEVLVAEGPASLFRSLLRIV